MSAEIDQLAALAIRSLAASDTGMAALESVVRAAMMRLGGSLLEGLLAADPGYRGPRIDCGAGHQGRFTGYRDKTIDTVVGRVRLARAYYHCTACGHGLIPKDGELGVADLPR
ncbi:MAG: hypothetical protein L0H59_00360 [Tomitella sp.]|nr:hypothetical protein [Tomitella sp.]